MRSSQLIIRIIVFLCVALDPGDSFFGMLVGISIAAAIGFVDVKTRAPLTSEHDIDSQ